MGSAEQEALWNLLKEPGTLRLQTQLNLTDMLRPAVQPGAHLDHTFPAERVTLTFTASCPFTLQIGEQQSKGEPNAQGVFTAQARVSPQANVPVPVQLALETHDGPPSLHVSYHTAEDARLRALPLRRLLLPWAELRDDASEKVVQREIPELKGGSWGRGRKIFFSEEAGCAKCHTINDQGGTIGPNLSNLVHRDYASVLRDVTEPSFAINPDYVNYVITLKDGRQLTGALRAEGETLLIGDEKGQVTKIARQEVEQLQPAAKSIMPEGLPKQLGPDRLKDLMTFLLTNPPHMPLDAKEPPPPPRTRAEVQAVLAGSPKPPLKTRPLHVVLVAGKKDHGPGEHDYPAWQKAWAELMTAAENLQVATAWEWPSADNWKRADVMVFFQHGTWNAQRAKEVDAFLARGGGLVYIHWAVDGGAEAPGFAQRIGLASVGGKIRFRHGPLDLGFVTGNKQPIGRNFSKVHFHDESYWQLRGDPSRINLLASSMEDGALQPQFWTLEPSKGRVFVSIPGHYSWTFDDPLFRVLLLRGIAWTAREPVDRFNELVWIGARVVD
jgi:putative heme-binding domain-containing protein